MGAVNNIHAILFFAYQFSPPRSSAFHCTLENQKSRTNDIIQKNSDIGKVITYTGSLASVLGILINVITTITITSTTSLPPPETSLLPNLVKGLGSKTQNRQES